MTWDDLSAPWKECLQEGWTSYCEGSLPIGAVIVDKDQNVISRGRNRTRQDEPLPYGARNREVMHAEVLAIQAMDDHAVPRGEAVLYTTMEPCPMCLGTWYMSGMRVLHYAARDPYAGATDLLETTWYMRKKQKIAHGPDNRYLESALRILSVETEYRHRGRLHPAIEERWRPVFGAIMDHGNTWATDKRLREYRADHASAETAFSYLFELVDREL